MLKSDETRQLRLIGQENRAVGTKAFYEITSLKSHQIKENVMKIHSTNRVLKSITHIKNVHRKRQKPCQ